MIMKVHQDCNEIAYDSLYLGDFHLPWDQTQQNKRHKIKCEWWLRLNNIKSSVFVKIPSHTGLSGHINGLSYLGIQFCKVLFAQEVCIHIK